MYLTRDEGSIRAQQTIPTCQTGGTKDMDFSNYAIILFVLRYTF